MAEALSLHSKQVLAANQKDIQKSTEKGSAFIDRLSLQQGRLQNCIEDMRAIASLPDPVGEVIEEKTYNELHFCKKRVPIGVLGVIYEARPNVTIDIATLAFKTGNSVILRGSSETLETNQAIVNAFQEALCDFPCAIQLITTPDRAAVTQLLKMDAYIDMIIPRGGYALHQFCKEHSTIPVITGGIGICHLFVEASAKFIPSVEVIVNAKTQRPSVCNALDTLLVEESIAKTFLPAAVKALQEKGVTFVLDEKAWNLLDTEREKNPNHFRKAQEADWKTEWLSLTLGIKIVESIEYAIQHIQKYSSKHSDGILSEDKKQIERFVSAIDTACLYINASTRFTDGGQFGFGAEVAISTQKLHARGPMGLKELTSYKWIVQGNYTVRGS